MHTSGANYKSAGIRFNIANEHTLVDRESTWIFTLDNNATSCTNNHGGALRLAHMAVPISQAGFMKRLFHIAVDFI
jgi:hypothetical protein